SEQSGSIPSRNRSHPFLRPKLFESGMGQAATWTQVWELQSEVPLERDRYSRFARRRRATSTVRRTSRFRETCRHKHLCPPHPPQIRRRSHEAPHATEVCC